MRSWVIHGREYTRVLETHLHMTVCFASSYVGGGETSGSEKLSNGESAAMDGIQNGSMAVTHVILAGAPSRSPRTMSWGNREVHGPKMHPSERKEERGTRDGDSIAKFVDRDSLLFSPYLLLEERFANATSLKSHPGSDGPGRIFVFHQALNLASLTSVPGHCRSNQKGHRIIHDSPPSLTAKDGY